MERKKKRRKKMKETKKERYRNRKEERERENGREEEKKGTTWLENKFEMSKHKEKQTIDIIGVFCANEFASI